MGASWPKLGEDTMPCIRRLRLALQVALPMLLVAACGPDPMVTAVQQTVMRDVANAGGLGTRDSLALAEFVQDEFAAADPTISWAIGPFPKDSADAALYSVAAQIGSSQAGFPKVSLRFKYDPITHQVIYRDMLVGKKPFVGKDGRQGPLANTYETIKTQVQAKAVAKAEEKAKKKAAAEKKKSKEQKSSSLGAT